jgi:hypothetical protein
LNPWHDPESALGDFRQWLRNSYIGNGRFAKYIEQKVAQKELPASFAQLALSVYGQESEEDPSEFIEPDNPLDRKGRRREADD